MECIDDNPVYVQGGGGCVYGVYDNPVYVQGRGGCVY